MYNPYSLIGKTILVTGASSGIGRATAVECSRLGASVILTARREEQLQETFSMLDNTHDGQVHSIIVADLSTDEGINSLVDNLPTINSCSLNAGISKNTPLQFIKREVLETVININTTSQILLTKQLAKKKKLQSGASIVFTASVSGNQTATPAHCIYSTSKGALVAFMKGAAIDLAPKKIRCNSVNPGMVSTDMINDGKYDEDQRAADIAQYPLKRYGEPQEVAFAICFLLSDAAQWITGHSLVIDGGLTLK